MRVERLNIEDVYSLVVQDATYEGKLIGVWPGPLASKLGATQNQVKRALRELQEAGRVYELNYAWYPGDRAHGSQALADAGTLRDLLQEAWLFIARLVPETNYPPLMQMLLRELNVGRMFGMTPEDMPKPQTIEARYETLRTAALALVHHDRAADRREDLPGCIELQDLEAVLQESSKS